MALSAVFGGVLTLVGLAGTWTLRAYGLAGLLLATWWIARSGALRARRWWRASPPWLRVATLVLAAAILLRLVAAAFHPLNAHDDHQGYLVFPVRMLETGSFAPEPFSERRLLALGGQSFLQALQLAWVRWRFANTTDLGLGWLVLVGLVAGHLARRRVLPAAALLVLLALQWERAPVVNLSSTVTGTALQYALLRTWFVEPAAGWRSRWLLLGLTLAGLCSLKSSLLAGAVVSLGALWLAAERADRPRRLAEIAAAALLAGVLLVPWMVQLHGSSGTWLYPVLGQGFHGSTYSDFPGVSHPVRASEFADGLPLFLVSARNLLALGVVPLVCLLLVDARRRPVRQLVALWVASWSAAFVLSVQSGGLDRYAYPLVMAATLFVLVECLPRSDEARARAAHWRVAAAALLAGFVWIKASERPGPFAPLRAPLGFAAESQRADYRSAQAVVPPGAEILACASRPFLFDFGRNPIYTVDHAGGASPPPGMPVRGSTEAFAGYLRSVPIRYVIYSHADEASYGRRAVGDRLSLEGGFYADRTRKLAEYNIAFRDHLTGLAKQGAKVFDNGRLLVLDLEAPPIVVGRP
jgi:hypothetical protein